MSGREVQEVRNSFGKKQILDGFSFSCETGEIIGIFGRNGSEKTTLLKCMLGTLKADSIKIKIDREEIKPLEVIPQDTFLPKEMKKV